MISTKNFAKSELSTGITNSATTLTVLSGHGAKFTIGDICVIWDKSVSDPADDSTHEVVEVTGISTDTLTIVRGREGTTAVAHNIGGKTYGIFADVTAGVLAKLPQTVVVTSNFAKTSNTTLGNIPGLSINLDANSRYVFSAVLFYSPSSGGGSKFSVAGTCTATSSIVDFLSTEDQNSANNYQRGSFSTVFNGDSASVGTSSAHAEITGEIVVNAAGTITIQFAQQNSDSTASTVLVGSWLIVTKI